MITPVLLFRILILPLLIQVASAKEETIQFKGLNFRIFRADPENVKIAWKNKKGQILHSLKAGKQHFEKEGGKVRLITNGGIFEPGCIPSGLHIESGKLIRPLNLKPGKGNFFLKPNGVFLISKHGKASIWESGKLAASSLIKEEKIRLATQSGPLLLSQGKIHPAFRQHSKNRLHRNGVGVDREGKVVLAITERRVNGYCNLWTFAALFKHLDCHDALFLDGDLSRMIVNPPTDQKGQGFASMLAVVEETSDILKQAP